MPSIELSFADTPEPSEISSAAKIHAAWSNASVGTTQCSPASSTNFSSVLVLSENAMQTPGYQDVHTPAYPFEEERDAAYGAESEARRVRPIAANMVSNMIRKSADAKSLHNRVKTVLQTRTERTGMKRTLSRCSSARSHVSTSQSGEFSARIQALLHRERTSANIPFSHSSYESHGIVYEELTGSQQYSVLCKIVMNRGEPQYKVLVPLLKAMRKYPSVVAKCWQDGLFLALIEITELASSSCDAFDDAFARAILSEKDAIPMSYLRYVALLCDVVQSCELVDHICEEWDENGIRYARSQLGDLLVPAYAKVLTGTNALSSSTSIGSNLAGFMSNASSQSVLGAVSQNNDRQISAMILQSLLHLTSVNEQNAKLLSEYAHKLLPYVEIADERALKLVSNVSMMSTTARELYCKECLRLIRNRIINFSGDQAVRLGPGNDDAVEVDQVESGDNTPSEDGKEEKSKLPPGYNSCDPDLIALHGILYMNPHACRELRALGLPSLEQHFSPACLRVYSVCAMQDPVMKRELKTNIHTIWALLQGKENKAVTRSSTGDTSGIESASSISGSSSFGLNNGVTTCGHSADSVCSTERVSHLLDQRDFVYAVLQLLNVVYCDEVIVGDGSMSYEKLILKLIKTTPFDCDVQEYAIETLGHLARSSNDSRLFLIGQGAKVLLAIAKTQFFDNSDVMEVVQNASQELEGKQEGWRLF